MANRKLLWSIPLAILAVALIVFLAARGPDSTEEPQTIAAVEDAEPAAPLMAEASAVPAAPAEPSEPAEPDPSGARAGGETDEQLEARKGRARRTRGTPRIPKTPADDVDVDGKRVVVPKDQVLQAAQDEPVSDPLSDGAFYAALDDWRGVQNCLTEHPADPGSKGAIRMRIKIRPNGEVEETRAYDTEGTHAQVIRSCVEESARTVKFPSFRGRQPVEKEATFVF